MKILLKTENVYSFPFREGFEDYGFGYEQGDGYGFGDGFGYSLGSWEGNGKGKEYLNHEDFTED